MKDQLKIYNEILQLIYNLFICHLRTYTIFFIICHLLLTVVVLIIASLYCSCNHKLMYLPDKSGVSELRKKTKSLTSCANILHVDRKG